MRITVVVVCHNSKETIASTIKSVTYQDYENKQIIVVNDGSVDGSLDIIKDMREKCSEDSCYLEGFVLERQFGEPFCKNLVVRQVWDQTNAFLFLKPTDRLLPYALTRFAQNVDDAGRIGLVYSDEIHYDKDERKSRVYKSSLIPESAAIGGNFLVTKRGFETVGEFKEIVNSDIEFVQRLSKDMVTIHIPEALIRTCVKSA